MPWGIASDRFGNRWVVALGIALTALTMVGFAGGHTEGSLIFWRVASGVAAAAVYVPLTGAIARWFPERERGFSQGTLGGVGGTLGEAAAYFLLPVLAIYFASGWRQGTNMIAGAIGVIAIVCVVFLKSAPSANKRRRESRSTGRCSGIRSWWCYAFLYSGFIVGIRGTQTWIAVYVADVSIDAYGTSVNQAVVYGGFFALVAYSVWGARWGVRSRAS